MEEDGMWVTINGAHVFIKEGQSPMDAFIKQKGGTNEQSREEIKKEIVDIVNSGQVFEFSPGPTMTLCSRYENGEYTNLYSSGDSPMSAFEKEIVPYLSDRFVVVEDNVGKIPRHSRFKKYGYRKVGEIKATEKDIMQGVYTSNEKDSEWANSWVLMKKKGM